MSTVHWKFAAAIVIAAAYCCLAGGCTPQERMGYSPIPQNSPASWEYSPYGPIHN